MYGQTEATARMAYLPPDLARVPPGRDRRARSRAARSALRAACRTRPRRRTPASSSTAGPNVMLGYAERPADLRLGRTVDELRTGDIARRDRRRAVRDRRPAQPVREDPRPADRPAAGRGRCWPGTASPRAASAATTSSWWRSRRHQRPGVGAAAGRGRVRPAAPGGARPALRRAAPAAHRQARLRQAVRELARRCADPPPPVGRPAPTCAASTPRSSTATTSPTDEQLRQPRRRLAVLRGDVAAAGAGARPPAGRLAHPADPRPAPVARRPATRPATAVHRSPAHRGDQRRPAGDRDRAHRRHARPPCSTSPAAPTCCSAWPASTSPGSTSPTAGRG